MQQPNAKLLPWLTHLGFLTEKLRSETGDARLEVLTHQWQKPDLWDVEKLSIQPPSILNRTICMWSLETACWFARTVLPAETYASDALLFARLKTEPLGNLIFHDNKIARVSHKYYAIDKHSLEYKWLNVTQHQNAEILWVRLSEFMVYTGFGFFLVEIILPGLEQCLCGN